MKKFMALTAVVFAVLAFAGSASAAHPNVVCASGTYCLD